MALCLLGGDGALSLCLLGGDVLGLILEGLRNPLDPRAAVSLGSVSRRLRALTQELRRQLRADHESVAELCLCTIWCHSCGGHRLTEMSGSVPMSCKELHEAKTASFRFEISTWSERWERWERRSACPAQGTLATLGTLGLVLPALEELLLTEYHNRELLLEYHCLEAFQMEHRPPHDGVQQLAVGLNAGALPALTTLIASCMHVGDAGASALGAALGRGALPRLKSLTLQAAAIGDAGLVALAPALWGLPALEELGLQHNPLSDEGLAALVAPPPPAGALSPPAGGLAKLKRLNLGFTQVSEAGCAALSSALNSGTLPALGHLHLKGVPASAAAKAAVGEALKQAAVQRWRALEEEARKDFLVGEDFLRASSS
eukprot:scaffold92091_cov69-Phaeocystis_antarctica.AAC.1